MSALLTGVVIGMGLVALFALACVLTAAWRDLWNAPIGRQRRVNERIRKLDGGGST